MKKILLIDDLRDFRDEPEGLVIARTSAEALALLEQESTWDEIWFDHDLGLLVNGTPDTTMTVVDYLGEREFSSAPVSIGTAFIHTSNPPGRDNLRRGLWARGIHCCVVQSEQFFQVQ